MTKMTRAAVEMASNYWWRYRNGIKHLAGFGRLAPTAALTQAARLQGAVKACLAILRKLPRKGRARREAAALFGARVRACRHPFSTR